MRRDNVLTITEEKEVATQVRYEDTVEYTGPV